MKTEKKVRNPLQHFLEKMFITLLMLLLLSTTYAQEQTVQGSISDESKTPIPGANILIKGTSLGTVSDMDGKFSMKVPSANSVLVVSFVGYQAQEVRLSGQTTVNVVLKELKAELDNIVVVGYGIQKKSDLTGAVATISSEQLIKTSSTGAVQALQGKAAGVQVFQSSGMPGAPITVRVRGINTITKKDEWSGVSGPIYIIDGIPGDINSINPNDIKSIEVLKDASSQAIYGSSGGNGVILVSTKQGSKNQKPKLELSISRGLQSNDLRVDMCDTREFIEIYNSLETTKKTRITANPDSLPSTNWWNEISQNAILEDYNLSISSGTENSTSLFSLGYLNQEGVVQKTEYKRYNIRVNSTYNIAKWLKVGENISLAVTRNRGNDGWGSPMGAINQSPISYVRDTSSNLTAAQIKDMNIGWGGWAQPLFGTGAGNPVAGIYYDNNRSGTYRMAGNLFANVQLLKGLTYNNNFGFDINFYENDNFQPYYYITSTQNNSVVQVSRTLNRNFSWNWQHVINYNTTLFEKHDIDLMAGFEASEYLGKTLSGSADSLLKNGASPEYQYIDATLRQSGSLYYKAGGGYGHSSRYAYFGRVNYQYNNIFLAQFSCRYDGSTNFAPANRFGLFPAFSTGFKFTELDIFKDKLTFLSFGKVRFGWGKTGNDGIPGNKFYSLVGVSAVNGYPLGGVGTPGGIALAPGNQELHWETITTYNYGIDLNFFDNKLAVTADYFDKNTSGMLQSLALPLIVGRYGFTGTDGKYTDHIGSLSNKGFEFAANYKDKVGELKYSIDFNITKIVSRLYNLTDTFTLPDWDSNPKSILRNGDAPGVFWGYQTDGLFRPEEVEIIEENGKERAAWKDYIPYKLDNSGKRVYAQNSAKPGDQRFVDSNGDFILNNSDKTVIGDPNPDFTFGLTINLEYKGFDLNCFFQGSYGNDIFNASKSGWYNSTGLGNWTKDALNAYRAPLYDADGAMIDPGNTTSDQFRLYGSTNDNYRMSDWYVEDGSYIRLKALQLGYTLPVTFTKRYGVERLRVYVGGRNLITWTKYTGLDPELGGNDPTYFGVDGGSYPQPKMYNVGVNVSF
jgi:TonB-dependent starch-binding outer membrane protein SusC